MNNVLSLPEGVIYTISKIPQNYFKDFFNEGLLVLKLKMFFFFFFFTRCLSMFLNRIAKINKALLV